MTKNFYMYGFDVNKIESYFNKKFAEYLLNESDYLLYKHDGDVMKLKKGSSEWRELKISMHYKGFLKDTDSVETSDTRNGIKLDEQKFITETLIDLEKKKTEFLQQEKTDFAVIDKIDAYKKFLSDRLISDWRKGLTDTQCDEILKYIQKAVAAGLCLKVNDNLYKWSDNKYLLSYFVELLCDKLGLRKGLNPIKGDKEKLILKPFSILFGEKDVMQGKKSYMKTELHFSPDGHDIIDNIFES